jgi:uncharacterized phage infection (PIP) family protein YhgE
LNKAQDDTQNFSNKVGSFVAGAAKAFLALGAAVGTAAFAIGVSAVKAAIEDEKAQKSLETTLKNVTKASADQVKGVEAYITKTSLAFGVTDDKLRPSLDRLLRSTQDVTKAQQLQSLALDISAGTGKDLQAVSDALGKAYDGNFTALKKLGVPLDESIIKSKDFTKVTEVLSATFKDQATVQAETFAGKMDRIKIAVSEAKETLGAALLPILEKIAGFINTEVVPAIDGLVAGLTGEKSIRQATLDAKGNVNLLNDDLNDANESGRNLGEALRELAESIGLVGSGSSTANPEFSKFVDNITKLVDGVNGLFDALQRLGSITGGVLDFVGLQGLIARVENAGERFRGEPTSGGQYGPTIQQTVIFNPLNSKDAAKKTLKSLNDASKTGNIGQFVKPMIPGR